jgi:TnpA family transposase
VDMGAVLMQLGSRRRDRYRRWAAREKKAHMIQMLALYWADGTRSLAEISRLVAAELGYTNPDFIEFYFDLLADAGIVEIVTA